MPRLLAFPLIITEIFASFFRILIFMYWLCILIINRSAGGVGTMGSLGCMLSQLCRGRSQQNQSQQYRRSRTQRWELQQCSMSKLVCMNFWKLSSPHIQFNNYAYFPKQRYMYYPLSFLRVKVKVDVISEWTSSKYLLIGLGLSQSKKRQICQHQENFSSKFWKTIKICFHFIKI